MRLSKRWEALCDVILLAYVKNSCRGRGAFVVAEEKPKEAERKMISSGVKQALVGQSLPEGLKVVSSEPSSIVQAAYHREELLRDT